VKKRLRFVKATQLGDIVGPVPKTKIWTVRNTQTRISLGEGRWRQYSFLPNADLVFERTCLRTIADFCERQTQSHMKRARS